MNNNIESILKLQLSNQEESSKIFKNEMYLSKNFFPTTIEYRDKEFRQLGSFFNGIFNFKGKSLNFFQTVTLIGPIGSGKSTVAKIFGSEIENYSKNNSKVKIIYRHINCRRNNTIFLILFDLLRGLIPNFPNRGFSSLELINMLHIILNSSNSYLILTLDEIDYIFHDKELALFFNNLSLEVQESSFYLERRISLIFITRNKDFLLLIDPNNKFGIVNNLIRFDKYNDAQLKSILYSKSINSFKEGVLPIETLDFIVKISEKLGDLRLALELLWRTGKNAELENSNLIYLNHAKQALNSILFVATDKLISFSETEILLLQCMDDLNDEFQFKNHLNMKKLKALFYIKIEQQKGIKDEKNNLFNRIVEKFVFLKIIEKYDQSKEDSERILENTYYLKIMPNLILQSINN